MGEETKIEWAHSTFNPWWGCEKVSPACAHCYAETLANRYGHKVWGATAPRRLFGEKHWTEPLAWNRKAAASGQPWRVFCGSMCDVFEDHPTANNERQKLWPLIAATPALTWMLLTKRPENMKRFAPEAWRNRWPDNVWAGTTVEDQQRADSRIPELLKVPARVRFLSMEPLLGPVRLDPWHLAGLNWIIAGGESGPGARPPHPDWFRSVQKRSRSYGVGFFFKQWGEWKPLCNLYAEDRDEHENGSTDRVIALEFNGDIPEDHQPDATAWLMDRVGKKAAGRLLDGHEWNEVPS
ncbi:MAG TPA: phage Gp37/Gp68 family protein [Methylomirabilota bacterium]|nr:phage Gp37/Gp68 family protein [Methylomirabilota bacterium]